MIEKYVTREELEIIFNEVIKKEKSEYGLFKLVSYNTFDKWLEGWNKKDNKERVPITFRDSYKTITYFLKENNNE